MVSCNHTREAEGRLHNFKSLSRIRQCVITVPWLMTSQRNGLIGARSNGAPRTIENKTLGLSGGASSFVRTCKTERSGAVTTSEAVSTAGRKAERSGVLIRPVRPTVRCAALTRALKYRVVVSAQKLLTINTGESVERDYALKPEDAPAKRKRELLGRAFP